MIVWHWQQHGSGLELELAIRGGTVLTPSGLRSNVDVGVAGGCVAAVGEELPTAGSDIDAAGLYVLPGFVDVHVHGAGGSSDLTAMAAFLPSTGVTAFLPTLAASSSDDTLAFVEAVADVAAIPGAEVLGSHLEGPYLSEDRCGAQPRAHLRRPDSAEITRLMAAARGSLRRMTLAPELPGGRLAVEQLRSGGVQVSLGHSSCSYERACEAAGWGASSVTHTYNAMAPFHHRKPGLVGAALTNDQLLAELIADGVHVHRSAALALIRARGPDGVAVVSDGLPCLGQRPGTYDWQGRAILSDGTVARLQDGSLAGSATPMLQALRNLAAWDVPLEDASRMVSRTGAVLAGAADRKGTVAEGFDADLVLLDSELRLVGTYCRGQLAFRSG